MKRACVICGAPYEGLSERAKYCSSTCRSRASRGATTSQVVTDSETTQVTGSDIAPVVDLNPPVERGPVEAALFSELSDVDRAGSALGQAALTLARRVDAGRDMGTGLAALVRQMEATRASATADVKSAASPLDKARDQLAERRAARGA